MPRRREPRTRCSSIEKRAGQRTLGFCCSQLHADFMADYFRSAGVKAVAVHSGDTSGPRASSLEQLESGGLDAIFAVDMFNEGVDLPQVDTVMMLRPTESSTIWLQQFGRGLRNAEGKDRLTVIDYIGNHRTFLTKTRALLQPLMQIGPGDREISVALQRILKNDVTLPEGCEVTYELEAVDIIKSLLRPLGSRGDSSLLRDFRDRRGERPRAAELFHDGYNPGSLRKSHGSWLHFVREMGDLTDTQQQVLDEHGEFLDAIEVDPHDQELQDARPAGDVECRSITWGDGRSAAGRPILPTGQSISHLACRCRH